jgi:hypothetical protein
MLFLAGLENALGGEAIAVQAAFQYSPPRNVKLSEFFCASLVQ